MAQDLDDETVESLVAEAGYRGLASELELQDQLGRYPKRRGNGAVRRALDLEGGPQRTRSNGERALIRALRNHGLTGFEANARVCGKEVDLLWRAQRFAVELDGWDGHKGRVAFERDRAKWALLRSGGIDVMPVGGRRLKREPEKVVSEIKKVLQRLA